MNKKSQSLKTYILLLVFISQVIPVSFFTYLSLSEMKSELREKFSDLKDQTERNLASSLNVLKKLSKKHRSVILTFIEERVDLPFGFNQHTKEFKEKELSKIRVNLQDRFYVSLVSQNNYSLPTLPEGERQQLEEITQEVLKKTKNKEPFVLPFFIESNQSSKKKIVLLSFSPLKDGKGTLIFTRKETIENELFEELSQILEDLSQSSPLLKEVKFHFDAKASLKSEFEEIKPFQIGILNKNLDDTIFIRILYDLEKEKSEIFWKQMTYLSFYLMILILCFLIAIMISRFLSHPLLEMVKDIKQVSSKDLNHPIRPVKIKELTKLRNSVDSLVQSLKAKIKKIQTLNKKILETQEEERERIARELHDSIGQNLVSIKLQLELLNDTRLEKTTSLIGHTIEELRSIYTSLYPSILSDLGLKKALEWYLSSFVRKNIRYSLKFNMTKGLSPKVSTHLYRISQELVSNMQKHSQGDFFEIEIKILDGYLEYRYTDNGIGLREQDKSSTGYGFGLENIKIRVESLGGNLNQNSVKGSGMELILSLPLK